MEAITSEWRIFWRREGREEGGLNDRDSALQPKPDQFFYNMLKDYHAGILSFACNRSRRNISAVSPASTASMQEKRV